VKAVDAQGVANLETLEGGRTEKGSS